MYTNVHIHVCALSCTNTLFYSKTLCARILNQEWGVKELSSKESTQCAPQDMRGSLKYLRTILYIQIPDNEEAVFAYSSRLQTQDAILKVAFLFLAFTTVYT